MRRSLSKHGYQPVKSPAAAAAALDPIEDIASKKIEIPPFQRAPRPPCSDAQTIDRLCLARERCSVPVCVLVHHRSRSIDASRRAPSKLKSAERSAAPDERSPSSYHHRDPERIFPTVTRRQQRCRNSVAVIKLHGGFGDRGADDHRLRELGSRLCGWATSPPVTVPG